MTSLARRLTRLEDAINPTGHVITLRVATYHSREDVAKCLAAHDITIGRRDLLVLLNIMVGPATVSGSSPQFVSTVPRIGR